MNQGRLLIKHAVGGRTFIDSVQTSVSFSAVETGEGWRIEADIRPGKPLEDILKWKDELNVFIFEEHLEPVRKNWFYVVPGGVRYDGKLRIEAASRLSYIPDEYTW